MNTESLLSVVYVKHEIAEIYPQNVNMKKGGEKSITQKFSAVNYNAFCLICAILMHWEYHSSPVLCSTENEKSGVCRVFKNYSFRYDVFCPF